ncbi:DUF3800 domain-containing protein [Trinickia sp. NRRL B-1857]|uniref:DUF3800 domain-containing protein n=1 Tax=Trinickia sp. NRRL B-1857 TaxID=3162879 RepID=UPI003D2E9CAE
MTYICYIDEAGNSAALPSGNTDNQPVLVIAGLIVQQDALSDITREFLALKRKYFPGSFTSIHLLDDVREEIKGSDLRSAIRKKAHKATTQLRFIDETLELLERYECRILADIWVKGIGTEFKARETYTQSVQHACRSFQAYLESKDARGFMVADFRTTQLNDQVAHSIFTQKYRAKGDPFSHILELPTFGVSNNHVGLQITDILCTTLLFPMASSVYCFGHVTGVHVNARDLVVRRRYAKRVKNLQFKSGAYWSVSVWDKLKKRASAELFVVPPLAAKSTAQAQHAKVEQMAKRTSRPAQVDNFGLILEEVLKKGSVPTNDPAAPVITSSTDGARLSDEADRAAK